MNPRQRRGLVLLVLAGLGLVLVFVLVAGYVADVRGQVEPKVSVLTLRQPARENEPFGDQQLRSVQVPARWAPEQALRDASALTGLVAGTDLPAGTVLQRGMAIAPPALEAGQREYALLVNAETGVAGKVEPESIVDVVAAFGPEDEQGAYTTVLIPKARVLEVGQVTQERQAGATQPEADPEQVVPITFALSVQETLRLQFAESFAAEVRLALRRPGDLEVIPRAERAYSGRDDR